MGKSMNKAGVTPRNLHQKWQFGVEISGFTSALFTKADLPEFEFEEVKFSPGGAIFDQKTAGRISFSDTTLEMGESQGTNGDELLNWAKKCVDILNNSGAIPSSYMRTVDIVEYDRAGKEFKRWRLHGAWVKTGKFGELEGGASDNTIKTMTLTYQYFTLE